MQCACAILSSVACPAPPYFFRIISQRARFSVVEGGVIEHKMCVLIFCTSFFFSKTFLIMRRIERDMTTNVYRSACEDCNEI